MSSDPSRDARVRGALVDTLFSQSAPSTLAASVVLAVFLAFQWGRQPAWLSLSWFALQCVPVITGAVSGVIYRRQARLGRRPDPDKWLRVFMLNLGALGGMWGAGTVLFFETNDLIGTSLTIVFSGGVTAGALLGVSCHPRAFVVFASLALVPCTVLSLSSGLPEYRTIGLGVIAFLVFCLISSRNIHASFRRSLELRFENEDLAKRLGEEKERAERALAQKSKVLAAASHDLRQPLHALGMFIELLGERLEDGEERAFHARIRASSQALGGLLNALLDLSRLDANSVRPRREHFRLARLFDQLAAEYSESARRKGLSFRASGGDLVVESDPELLARLVRNLLSNAVRFTASGEVALDASDCGGGRIQIAISDTGPGIPHAEHERIFDEFYQVGNTERDREQGLGLGLAIVRGLSRLLDHPVTLRSSPQRPVGSEFVVELPAGDAELALEEEIAKSSRPTLGKSHGQPVLIIDDERDIREGLAALLESWGYRPISASTLEEALQTAGAHVPDVVLCDFRLRGQLTGADVLAELERRWSAPLTSIIVTGDTSPERIQEAKRSGRPVLFKPVLPGKLRALLGALAQRSYDDRP